MCFSFHYNRHSSALREVQSFANLFSSFFSFFFLDHCEVPQVAPLSSWQENVSASVKSVMFILQSSTETQLHLEET